MTRKEWQLALPILALLALCALAYLHGMRQEMAAHSTLALRTASVPQGAPAQPERLALVAGGALHVLDAQGRRLSRQPMDALGLAESPNDIDWALDPRTGQWQLWMVDDSGPRVRRCLWDEAQQHLHDCTTVLSGPQLKINPRSRAVHLAVDPAGPRIFLADAQGHGVQVFDAAGTLLGRTDPVLVPLSYPNRLRYLGGNRLLVADNDHRRLVWLELRPDGVMALQRSLYSRNHPQARVDRSKVTDAAEAPDGTLWLLAVRQGQRDGDVLVYGAGQRPVARAALPAGADPLVIDTLGGKAVVADFKGLDLYRIDAQGQWLGRFGDAALHAELQPLRDQALWGARWKQASLVVGVLVLVAGFALGLLHGAPPSASAAAVAAREREEAWWTEVEALAFGADPPPYPVALAVRPAFWGVLVGALLAGTLLLGAVLAVGVARWQAHDAIAVKPHEAVALALLVLAIALWPAVLRLRGRCLRITERRVGWFQGQRLLAQASLDEVVASPRALLVGRYRVPLAWHMVRGRIDAWDMPLLATALLGRLPPPARHAAGALERLWWQRQPRAVQAALLAWLLGAALLLGLALAGA